MGWLVEVCLVRPSEPAEPLAGVVYNRNRSAQQEHQAVWGADPVVLGVFISVSGLFLFFGGGGVISVSCLFFFGGGGGGRGEGKGGRDTVVTFHWLSQFFVLGGGGHLVDSFPGCSLQPRAMGNYLS